MSGFFGLASKHDCLADLFYGTDYHSHLGTRRGGLAVHGAGGFARHIHDITNAQFRSKFASDIPGMSGTRGIGVISDYEDQPLIIGSHLGTYAIVTVGALGNLADLTRRAYSDRRVHFSHMNDGDVNPTELVAALINQGATIAEGIRAAQEAIRGSCSLLLMNGEGVYAARDRLGRTPIVLGRKDGAAHAVALESCALPNLGYEPLRDLGPGEIVRLAPEGVEVLRPPDTAMSICAFLWVYYGFPASTYEGVNVEQSRYASGARLARRDDVAVDFVSGVPDSGTGHGLGYAQESGLPFKRPFVKYTPTWSRSFTPPVQSLRDTVARMKLLPIPEIVRGQRLLFCDDSIVRGTQLRDTAAMLSRYGAREVHARVACPPILFGCKYLNFSRSRSSMELIGRQTMQELTGRSDDATAREFADPDGGAWSALTERVTARLNLTSLRYQRLDDCVAAIGLPKSSLCTYCFDGCEGACAGPAADRCAGSAGS